MSDERQDKAIDLIKFVIHQAPVGYLSKVLEDLKHIINNKLISSEEIQKEIRTYEENHLEAKEVKLINSKVLISQYTKDASNYYYDQGKKVKFKINTISGEVENAEAINDNYGNRDQIENKLKEYISKYYKTETTKFNVYYEFLSHKVYIIINVKNINEKSFYSGEWISIWEFDVNDNKLKGNIKINSSYYEDTNVQFHLDKNFESNINGKSNDEIVAKDLVEFIEKSENEVQKELNETYENFSDDYVSPLRRRIPVIRQKMNWNIDQIQIGQITK